MNDSKYGRLYPERAVALAREVLMRVVEAGPTTVFCGRAVQALDNLDHLGFPPAEPLFLLRGQDELASDAVRFYADLVDHRLAGHGDPDAGLDMEHIVAVAARMEAWIPRKLPD